MAALQYEDSKRFSPDYATARERFRAAARDAGARMDALPLEARGPGGGELAIDLAWLGPAHAERVTIHVSGVHGVEGFAGSAIQLWLLQEPPDLPAGHALLFVHAVNPYGMAWLRRVNENNVDLNRNCLAGAEEYAGAPDLYRRLDRWLNRTKPPPRNSLGYAWLPWCLLRYGRLPVRESIMRGQYEYPQGLFYGGRSLEAGPRRLLAWLRERLAGVPDVFVIDVHTGLGPFGEDAVWVLRESGLCERLGARVRPFKYEPKGSLAGALEREGWTCVTHEFGVRESFRVLRALCDENRWHHYGRETHPDHPAAQRLLGAFCPHDWEWRVAVLQRARDLLPPVLRCGVR